MSKDYQIIATSPKTKADCTIRTDDPKRAARFARLLAASGSWDSVVVKNGKQSFTLDNLDGLT